MERNDKILKKPSVYGFKRLLSTVLIVSLLFSATEITTIAAENQDTDVIEEATATEITETEAVETETEVTEADGTEINTDETDVDEEETVTKETETEEATEEATTKEAEEATEEATTKETEEATTEEVETKETEEETTETETTEYDKEKENSLKRTQTLTADDSEGTVTFDTTFNIIVEAISYTDETFTTQGDAKSGESVPKMYQTDLQTLTYTGTDKAYFDLELDIQDIFDQLDLHTENGDYALGTPTAVSPDDYSYYGKINNDACYYAFITDVGGVSLKDSTLSMTNVRGLDSDNSYTSKGYFRPASSDATYVNAVCQVVIQIPYYVTEQKYDNNFTGKFDYGYIPTVIEGLTCGYSSSDMFSVYYAVHKQNIRKDNTKIPFLYVTHSGYPKSLEVNVIQLTNYYSVYNNSKVTDLRTGEVNSELDYTALCDLDSNDNPYIEFDFKCASANWQALTAFKKSIAQDKNDAYLKYVSEGSRPHTEGGDDYTEYHTKIKFACINESASTFFYTPTTYSKDTKYSGTFGLDYVYKFLVNNIVTNHTIKYYNIYDDGVAPVSDLKDNAVLVDTFTANDYTAKNDNAPSTEVEGYTYLKAKSSTEQDYYDKWNRTESVYRYFAKTYDVNIDYKLKFRAVYSDGTPAEGVALNDETTDENGFILTVTDIGSFNTQNCYYNSDTGLYNYSLGTHNDNIKDTISIPVRFAGKSDAVRLSKAYVYTGKDEYDASYLESFDSMFATSLDKNNLSITFEDDADDPYTKIAVVDVGNQEFTINVYDKYLDENGDEIKTVLRQTDTLASGDSYTYNALSVEGYTVVDNTTYSGIITSNLTLEFKYIKQETSSEPESETSSESESKTETETSSEPESETESETSSEPASEAESETSSEPESESETETETSSEAESESETEPETSSEPESSADSSDDGNFSDENEKLEATISNIKAKVYDQNAYEPTVKVAVTQTVNGKKKKVTLTEGGDYSVSYKDNVNAGTGKVIITGEGEYKGVAAKEFTIAKKPVKKLKIAAGSISGDVNLDALSALPVYVYDGTTCLSYGKDYKLTDCMTAKNGKTAQVTVEGLGNYTGTSKIKLKIYDSSKIIISPENVKVLDENPVYTGKAVIPKIEVTVDGTVLTEKTDYTVKYANNKEAGTAYVTVTGKGSYAGEAAVSFMIKACEENELTISDIKAVTYKGKLQKPSVSVSIERDGKVKKLIKYKDYTVTYANNFHAGEATVTITGKGNYAGLSAQKHFTINPVEIKKASVKGTLSTLVLTYAKRTLKEGKDYTTEYGEEEKSGKAAVTIKGNGDFTGTVIKKVKLF